MVDRSLCALTACTATRLMASEKLYKDSPAPWGHAQSAGQLHVSSSVMALCAGVQMSA